MESTKSRTAEIGMNHYLSKPKKRSVICDSERASLTVAQPYKDVFFSDFFRRFQGCQSETLTSESILQNHNFVGQIQVLRLGFLHQERPIRNHRKYPLWSIRLVLWFAYLFYLMISQPVFNRLFNRFSSWFFGVCST
jgi:hypothetical protein